MHVLQRGVFCRFAPYVPSLPEVAAFLGELRDSVTRTEAEFARQRAEHGKRVLGRRRVVVHKSLLQMYIIMYIWNMPKSYSVAAARAKLADIVDQVESGNEVELTRRGKKVAVLLSAAKYARLTGSRVALMTAFDNFCREHDLREIGVELIGLTSSGIGAPGEV